MSDQKYGLILPDKEKSSHLRFTASHNVFGNDSESEEESQKKPILLRPSDNINRQAKLTQEKAVIEDPTVYQYDEIYETLSVKKGTKTQKDKCEKKPKYIENLIKTANKRKLEHERRIERQIQKEREKEGDEFADKEIFVTSAYKLKLEELRKEEEKEKYEDYLENIGDVTRQKDLGGFYRHLYEQKLGANDIKENKNKQSEKNKIENVSKTTDTTSELSSKKRNYRKRKVSYDSNKNLSDGEIEDSEEEINRCNLEDIRKAKKSKQQIDPNIDADSDFSIDDSSDEDENKDKKLDVEASDTALLKSNLETLKSNEQLSQKHLKNDASETKVKIDIWKKRTVGVVFDQALKRYYERKAARGS